MEFNVLICNQRFCITITYQKKKKDSILQSLYDWIQAVGGIPLMSFVDFIDSLFVICILGKGTAYLFCVFPFSFFNKNFFAHPLMAFVDLIDLVLSSEALSPYHKASHHW